MRESELPRLPFEHMKLDPITVPASPHDEKSEAQEVWSEKRDSNSRLLALARRCSIASYFRIIYFIFFITTQIMKKIRLKCHHFVEFIFSLTVNHVFDIIL